MSKQQRHPASAGSGCDSAQQDFAKGLDLSYCEHRQSAATPDAVGRHPGLTGVFA